MVAPAKIRIKINTAKLSTAIGIVEPTPAGEAIQAAAIAAAWLEALCDPIRCQVEQDYTIPLVPATPVATPRITAKNSPLLFKGRKIPTKVYKAVDKAVRKQLLVTSYEACILRTTFRRSSALKEKDNKATRLQDKHFQKLTVEVLKKQKEANDAWNAVLKIINKYGLKTSSVSIKQVDAISNALWNNGFPHLEVILLKSFGLTDEAIHCMQLLQLMIPTPKDKSKITFVDVINGLMKINTFEDICQCRCLDC